jgi:hypothetical protein
MEEIRAFACDELLQLSHAGNEVGGVLFGTRRDGLIQIVTWRPIACEHVEGEALSLSFNDRMNLAVQLELSRQNADLKGLLPLGCFLSHVRDGVSMRASDLEIYNGFFPAAWQVALVIRPKGKGQAEVGFFVRESGEKLQTESSYLSFELQPLHAAPKAVEAPPAADVPAQSSRASEQSLEQQPLAGTPALHPGLQAPVQSTAPLGLRSGLPLGLLPGVPSSAYGTAVAPAVEKTSLRDIPPATFALPSFQTEQRVPAKERWMWAIPIVLALGIAAFLLYQRRGPTGDGIGLRVTNQDQTAQVSWDTSSRAVRDAYRGEIDVDDGGKPSQISLTSEQLHAGKMSYLAQSGDVGFEMTVYPANGDPAHDATRLIAPASHASTQPPQLLPETAPANAAPVVPAPASTAGARPATPVAPSPVAPTPAALNPTIANPANPPSADTAELQRQIQDLRASVGRERARADELQNLVRILENRLALQPAGAKPQSH